MRLPPVGFWSYARQDDDLSFGKLSTLRSLLVHELQQQYGRRQVRLFQDSATIPHGSDWENEINKAIGESTFFVPILTPNFIQSEWCMREVELFLERESALLAAHPALGDRRMLFPILFIDIEDVDPENTDALAALRKLQWFDFRRFRHRNYEEADVREAIADLAGGIRSLLKGRLDAGASDPPKPAPEPAADEAAPTMIAETPPPSPAKRAPRAIGQGDVLNHIFEVRRAIKAGGMGQVFEGANVNTGERVAIKALLPSLASDAKVVEMFQREALTLTRLSHEALVQYRVLAKEPELGALYIVTEFIDGVDLNDALDKVDGSEAALRRLLGRLAAGLGAAHRLGAIHRDMSPDNVMLPGGDLDEAKIIDFGIAKDLGGNLPTLIGAGFAGKLNFVAPEQLGEHGGEIGPWTDVYSLALVILCVAQGRKVDMSGSFADAIRKRRDGPDLSVAPEGLRPLLADMLRVDPAERLRSMDQVIARLGSAGNTVSARATARGAERPGPADLAPQGESDGGTGFPAFRQRIGAGIVLALVVALLIWMLRGGDGDPENASAFAEEGVVSSTENGVDGNSAAAGLELSGTELSWLYGRWCLMDASNGRLAINISTGQPIEWNISGADNQIITTYLGESQTERIERALSGEVQTDKANYARDSDGRGLIVRESSGETRLGACP